MQTSLHEIESAVQEAEQVRHRHDGVHLIHSYVTALHFYLSLAREGCWSEKMEQNFHRTLGNIRCIDRTGFPPHPDYTEDAVSQLSAH